MLTLVFVMAAVIVLLLSVIGFLLIKRSVQPPSRTLDMSNEFLRELARYGKQLRNLTQLTKITYRTIHEQPVPNDATGRHAVQQVEDLIRLAQRAAKIEAGGVP
jgi:hypothetical protein